MKKEDQYIFEHVPEITLLSVAPMLRAMDENEDDNTKRMIASAFNAELHAQHFEDIFVDIYGMDINNWAFCCIADNNQFTSTPTYWMLKPSTQFRCKGLGQQ